MWFRYIKFSQMDMRTLELRIEDIEKRSSSSQQLLNQSIKFDLKSMESFINYWNRGDSNNMQVALKILEAKIGTIEKNAADETMKLYFLKKNLFNLIFFSKSKSLEWFEKCESRRFKIAMESKWAIKPNKGSCK